MTRSLRIFLPSVCLALATTAFAQTPTPPASTPPVGAPRPPRGPRPAPTNLKALSKDTTGDQVIALMRAYEGELGVECEYCHARNPETKRNDFASDANPVKDKARLMIKMTENISSSPSSTAPSRKTPSPAALVTAVFRTPRYLFPNQKSARRDRPLRQRHRPSSYFFSIAPGLKSVTTG
jgi:hypothetical protein